MVVSALLNLRLTVLYSIRKDALHSTEVCQRSVTICCLSQAPQLSQRVSVRLQVYLGLSLRRAGYTPHTRRDVVPHCPAAREALHPPPPLTGRPTLTGGSRLTGLPTFPQRMHVPAIPTDLHRRQFIESYRSTQVFSLEETLKGDLICCLQFTGEETSPERF